MASRTGIHIYFPKYFMAVRHCIIILVLLGALSVVWLNGLNLPFISQQFNCPYQLIVVFLCTSKGPVPSMIWKQSRPSPRGAGDNFCRT